MRLPEVRHALSNAIVVISDLLEPAPSFPANPLPPQPAPPEPQVIGGYLERLPLAAIRAGLVDRAEIWHHHNGTGVASRRDDAVIRRSFAVASHAPFHSQAMLALIATYGAPKILCVYGLGVSPEILDACAGSTIIYNSIDVPALRVPLEVSQHFDLVLTGAQWQSDDVAARHPGMPTAILPVGPDFASGETFFPLPDEPKIYDVVYVAAAQPYKRHDILFDALARAPRPIKALCVVGYGEDGERLRQQASERHLQIDFVGPPGVPHAEVNRLINRARVGLVCGVDDGAPAILTEYMLADLPVVANAALRCGLQYITPQTGIVVSADRFEQGILQALSRTWSPRQVVLDNWAWPHSVSKLAMAIEQAASPKKQQEQPVEYA